jgi:hypothetical protein
MSKQKAPPRNANIRKMTTANHLRSTGTAETGR